MLTISVRTEFEKMALLLNDMGRRQLPFAMAKALTHAAQDAKADLRDAMTRAFDRPKPWTLNSLYVEPAMKNRLEANVHFKDFAPNGVPAGKYLRAQIHGGARVAKTHERRLAASGAIPPGYFLVPTGHADMDAHGNMRTGQITKILSALRSFTEVGFTANLRADGKSRGKRKAESYFAIVPGRPQGRGGRGGGLPPGIYKATGAGQGRKVVPVMALVKTAPKYGQRLDFSGVARRSYEGSLPRHLGEAMDFAMRTARA